MSLKDLPGLKSILRLKRNPPVHSPRLHTNHPLEPVFRREITHPLGRRLPRIPNNSIGEVIPRDVEVGFSVDEDAGGVLFEGLVDAVDFAVYKKLGCGIVFGTVEDFVVVFDACETGDFDL